MAERPERRPEGVIEVRRLGRTRYEDAHATQLELLDKRIADEICDQLVLTEHEPVVTVGRGIRVDDAASAGVRVVEVERGGEATWHGPGQLVVYPIHRLVEGRRDLHRYLRDLEEVVIGMLADVDVEGRREPGLTGVWIGDKKVCSIGVAVRRWVAWHGFALNVHSDLSAFGSFRPCGLDPSVMTRVADHAELPPTTMLFEVLAVKHFCGVFDLDLPPLPRLPEPGEGTDDRGFPNLPILPT